MTSILMCGLCIAPAEFHTDYHRNEYDFQCERNIDQIKANGQDLYYGSTTYSDFFMESNDLAKVSWLEDYSGPEAWSGSDLAQHRIATDRDVWGIGADDFDDPNDLPYLKELVKVANWNDFTYRETASTKSWVCTALMNEVSGEYVLTQNSNGSRSKEWLAPVNTESVDKTRNVFLEGNDGFTSVELLNLDLTEKYQNRLLNVFADKNGRVRIGSIVITENADGTKTATCVRDDCRLSATTPSFVGLSESAIRSEMEKFTWAIVAHGNNHAAHWFRSKPTYHKVHRFNCDISRCSEDTHYCAYILPDKEPKSVLVEHYENCRTLGCSCTELLIGA